MIPLHPVATDRADTLRWVLPAGRTPGCGRVAAAPGDLGAMLADGTLETALVADGAVLTRAAPGRSWAELGARVRTALHDALERPAAWSVVPDLPDDEAVRTAVGEVLAGELGALLRAHGGRIDLVGVHDGVAHVRLSGACHGCPAATVTLHARLEAELRRRLPGVRGVREVGGLGRRLSRPGGPLGSGG